MLPARIELDDDVVLMEIVNISETGAFVLTEHPERFHWIRMGERLDVDIFPTDNMDNITVNGLIIRIADGVEPENRGFGLAFTFPRQDARQKLRERLESHCQTVHGSKDSYQPSAF